MTEVGNWWVNEKGAPVERCFSWCRLNSCLFVDQPGGPHAKLGGGLLVDQTGGPHGLDGAGLLVDQTGGPGGLDGAGLFVDQTAAAEARALCQGSLANRAAVIHWPHPRR